MILSEQEEKFITEWLNRGYFVIKSSHMWCECKTCKNCKLFNYTPCNIPRQAYLIKHFPEEFL